MLLPSGVRLRDCLHCHVVPALEQGAARLAEESGAVRLDILLPTKRCIAGLVPRRTVRVMPAACI